ncbi:MAG: hypothetical protein ACYDGN_16375 [Acidimicrobiales bacterium]
MSAWNLGEVAKLRMSEAQSQARQSLITARRRSHASHRVRESAETPAAACERDAA